LTSYVSAAIRGAREPRVRSVPPYAFSHGQDALELAASAGLVLDAWQADIIVGSMGVRPDGKWSAFEVGVDVPRQNGKDAILEVRTLAGLYLIGERLITFSAHQFDTSLEAFRRLLELVEEADLQREIKRISRSHGEEGIELKTGQRVRYRTRTKGGGRGFSGDCLILNEAMILPESAMGSVFPTLSARPNPQVWYTGSAVDKLVHEHGVVFARVRDRGSKGDPRLAWFEFSAPFDHPDEVTAEAAADPEMWAQANPSLGIRISEEYVAAERRALADRTFAVERLGVGDWPDATGDAEQIITDEAWNALADPASKRAGAVCFTFDVSPDGRHAAIAVGGHRTDGLEHVEIVEHREGTGWLVDRLVELDDRHRPEVIACDGRSPAAAFIDKLALRGVTVEPVDAQEHARACQSLMDAVTDGSFRHLGTPELRAALKGAAKRSLVDAWAWSRKSSSVDISPLVAFTLARRQAEIMRDSVYESRGLLTITLD
jgi:hypothetical protein